ncbi:PhoX family protein [Catenuloplanes niger JCM 9533]|uniref:Secreted PhoX family phosphatase n=2 Tax=Micromonosporaceae TaxID=28056 RepID=A0AAE3ZYU9_9ACTN|nr:PhoX family phosphatase [Catenuloplanes niger]MDR7326280.1 secreted PhoX family phosphatase [Catenuloplanes niger]
MSGLPIHGGRSAMTCRYRCGNACAHAAPNGSGNPYFGDLVASRRTLFRAGAAGALVLGAGGAPGPAGAAPAGGTGSAGGALTFSPVPPNVLDRVLVPAGYESAVVIRWGDPILPDAPALDVHRQTPRRQERQFGFNNDFLGVLPLGRDRALLVANHEYTNEELMFPGFTSLEAMTVAQVEVAMAAHGMSVVEIERAGRSGRWRPVRGRRPYNRRLTMLSTPFRFDGPAAGSAWLRTAADPAGRTAIGTLNNCAGGVTPWGTVLSGEENVNQYFVGGDAAPEALKPRLARYGFPVATRFPEDSRRWERAQERFDLARHPNEAHRFGWIVEVDPYDPGSVPRKHTAMGRFKHEGANVIVSRRGNVAAYMGDDERFEYLYKFVSAGRYRPGDRRHNLSLLSAGTLYVARLTGDSPPSEIDGTGTLPSDRAFDGTGRWIPLASGNRSFVPGMTVEEVLTFTRQAGDAAGATRMDRPEDVQPSPRTGKIYAALTNNVERGIGGRPDVDEANPRRENRHGQVLEIAEDHGDHTGETFTWSLPIVCGDPDDPNTYFAGYDKSAVSPISCPDNVAFDAAGNLWLATDGNALGSNDGLFATPVEGPERGHLRQFLTVPPGAETCGPFLTGDGRSVFVAVQHPGEVDGATLDSPASRWPDGDFAKPAVTVVWRPDGGRVGS